MKKITVDSCENCMYRGHKGGFGNPGYIPKCNKVTRELPYTVEGTVANVKPGIPKWCPLDDDLKEYAELKASIPKIKADAVKEIAKKNKCEFNTPIYPEHVAICYFDDLIESADQLEEEARAVAYYESFSPEERNKFLLGEWKVDSEE